MIFKESLSLHIQQMYVQERSNQGHRLELAALLVIQGGRSWILYQKFWGLRRQSVTFVVLYVYVYGVVVCLV